MQSESSFPLRQSLVIVCAAILLSAVFCAQATAYDWTLQTKACSSTGAGSGDTATLGTTPGGLDPTPLYMLDRGKAYVAIDAGLPWLCSTDIRPTIPPRRGRPVTWELCLRVGPTYPYSNVEMRWWTGTDLKPWMSYWVEILNDPTGKYAPGLSYHFGATHIPSSSPVVAFSWSGAAFDMLKSAGLPWDIQMRLTAEVVAVPEPSGVVALVSGLLGLTFCIRRKRR